MAIEIINNLWLGDYKDGLNTTFLVEKNKCDYKCYRKLTICSGFK